MGELYFKKMSVPSLGLSVVKRFNCKARNHFSVLIHVIKDIEQTVCLVSGPEDSHLTSLTTTM